MNFSQWRKVMSYHPKNYHYHHEKDDDELASSAYDEEVSLDDVVYRKKVRRLLEERLDRRRLKYELDEFDGELEADFDWDDIKGK